jgi:hypothetical protein
MTFFYFTQLQEELQINILSYVADAPFEEKNDDGTITILEPPRTTNTAAVPAPVPANSTQTIASASSSVLLLSNRCLMYTSTLTHVLPLVCKQFHLHYSKSDTLWKDALLRQLGCSSKPGISNTAGISNNNDSWYGALANLMNHGIIFPTTAPTKPHDEEDCILYRQIVPQLIERRYQNVAQLLHSSQQHLAPMMTYQYLYRIILNTQLRYILPVFIMTGDVVLNESYGLHLFEFRYRYMMHQLIHAHTSMVRQLETSPSTDRNRNDEDDNNHQRTQRSLLEQYPMYFLHANHGSLRRSDMAVIVQVTEYDIGPDGRADIVVEPIQYVWIERSWIYNPSTANTRTTPAIDNRTHSYDTTMDVPNNLYYAQVLKMDRTATRATQRLQRQETLTTVMEHLLASGIVLHPHLNVFMRNNNVNNNDDDNDDDDFTDNNNPNEDEEDVMNPDL